MRRVVIVGANGAGKTWLATRLSACNGAPIISKDRLALTTGWRQRPKSAVSQDIAHAVAGQHWILEGGPSVLTGAVLERATLVIWLDIPTQARVLRILRRSIRYFGRTRPEHPPGNRDWPGLRQARFIWRALRAGAAFRRAVVVALGGTTLPVLHLRTRVDVMRFLRTDGWHHPSYGTSPHYSQSGCRS